MNNKPNLKGWADTLSIISDAMGIANVGVSAYTGISIMQAQVGLADAQKKYYNTLTSSVTSAQQQAKDVQTEEANLNNAKRRYLYGVATDNDLYLLIKYDIISGYIDEQGKPVVVTATTNNILHNQDEQSNDNVNSSELNSTVESILSDPSNITKIFTLKNVVIGAGIFLLLKAIK